MNSILCPVDFSSASLNALEYATRIALKHKSSIKLVHVVTEEEYNEQLAEDPERTVDHYKDAANERLSLIANEINTTEGLDYEMCRPEVATGELLENIEEISSDENISLIVMGTTGVTDIEEARVGSNTVAVIEKVDTPVLCIPDGISYSDFDRIVYGSTMEKVDREVLQPILNFAVPFDARIYVVHIAEEGKDEDEEYTSYVEEMKSYFVYEKLGFEQFSTDLETPIALEHVLNMHDADLLILVRRERSLFDRLFHRSVTKHMSYLTNFPLLVLHH